MKLIVIAMLVLMFFQYKTTKPTNFSQLTEMEKINQLRRMNEYPPSFYRLANLIEARPEAIIYFKLERNFLDIFDLPKLFTVYLTPIIFPFFLIGLFELIKIYPKQILVIASLPVVLLTLIGHENTKGPFSLLPIIYGCAVFGLIRLIGVIRRKCE
jgi:hypothetical protein